MKDRIVVLNSFRGIFCIFVMFYHLGIFTDGGEYIATYFVMVSGFILTYCYGSRIIGHTMSNSSFIKRRFRIIYPYHLLGFLLVALFLPSDYASRTPLTAALNLSLLQCWVPIPDIFFSYDGPSWCLSVLAFCYVCFPFLVRRLSDMPLQRLAMVYIPFLTAYFLVAFLVPWPWNGNILNVNPFVRLMDFTLGILLFRLMSSSFSTRLAGKLTSLGYAGRTLIELIFCGLAALIFLQSLRTPIIFTFDSYWWIPVFCFIWFFVTMEARGGAVTWLLRRPLFTWLSSISFAVYVIHVPVIGLYLRAVHFLGLGYDYVIGPGDDVIIICIVLCLSVIVTHLFNRLRRWGPAPV